MALPPIALAVPVVQSDEEGSVAAQENGAGPCPASPLLAGRRQVGTIGAEPEYTLLVADDSAPNLGVMAQQLEEFGFRVAVAQDGEEAYHHACLIRPDLILLDVLLPKMDGFATCRQLKATEATRDVPVIFMTALADTGDKVAGFQAGGVDYVTKPFQLAEVLARVNLHLALHSMRRQLELRNVQLQQEIVERSRAEEALEQQRTFLRQVIDINPHFIFAKDREGRYTLVNQALVNAFDTTVDAFLGKTDAEIKPGTVHAEAYRRDDLEVLRTLQEKVISEEPLLDAAGNLHWLRTVKRAIVGKDGIAHHILGVATDITARKQAEADLRRYKDGLEQQVAERTNELSHANAQLRQEIDERRSAEEALRASQQLLQAILDHLTTLVYVKDINGRYLLVNRHFEKLFGLASADVVGKTDCDLFAREQADGFRHADQQAIGAGSTVQVEEIAQHDDGPHTYVSVKCPLVDETGKAYAVCGISTDITERARDEAAIRELNESLERRVAARTLELERINLELEAFAYSVSHDMRAPLRSINGFVAILMESERARMSDDGRALFARVARAALRMGQLIDDMLKFSQISRTGLVPVAVVMQDLANAAARELRDVNPAVAVEVAAMPTVWGDRAMLRQVYVNLIGNALKFSGKREQPLVSVGALRQGGKTVFFVRDNGAGFDMTFASKLFGVFQRMHSEAEFPGTGVGLAIVKRVVERHHGEIWAEAAPERGATFYFTLGAVRGDAH